MVKGGQSSGNKYGHHIHIFWHDNFKKAFKRQSLNIVHCTLQTMFHVTELPGIEHLNIIKTKQTIGYVVF